MKEQNKRISNRNLDLNQNIFHAFAKNSRKKFSKTGLPLMIDVRSDVQTSEQHARLLYAWLTLGDEHKLNITGPKPTLHGEIAHLSRTDSSVVTAV